jgi:hypothetical protein
MNIVISGVYFNWFKLYETKKLFDIYLSDRTTLKTGTKLPVEHFF